MSDEEFLNAIRSLRCLACGAPPPSDAHHVFTRGAAGGPINEYWNLIPLCKDHHTLRGDAWHNGKLTFLEKYPHVWEHLKKLGWERNGHKLFHEGTLDEKKV